jgi:hypothetical protein
MTGRLLARYPVDRIFAPYVATVFFPGADRRFRFPRQRRRPLSAVWVVPMGLRLGTEIDLIAFSISRYFGQRGFGKLYGYFFMVFGLGSSLGRFLGGFVFDMEESHDRRGDPL